MKQNSTLIMGTLGVMMAFGCSSPQKESTQEALPLEEKITPLYVTPKLDHDSDDPAIWVNPEDPTKSLIVGTDKDSLGALYVFDIKGNFIDSLIRKGIQRPNNVDIGYGLNMGEDKVDFAVTGERLTSKLRFYSLPEMTEINPGGIEIYEGETGPEYRDLMGVAVYQSPDTKKTYVIAGRKNGPTDGTYLWQYEVIGSAEGIKLELVRKFGSFSGKKEIEAIAVDNEMGYIYYSDEGQGVKKYYADPAKGNEELALFATEGFSDDHEGISIYKSGPQTGYILVSDQGSDLFHVFPREGSEGNPNAHPLLKKLALSTLSSDGSEVSNQAMGTEFPKGIFVAMSDDQTFQIYNWEDLENEIKK